MDGLSANRSSNWVAYLREFLGAQQAPVEHCELCNAAIDKTHAHVIEPQSRRLLCACAPCALLFDNADAPRYRRIPREVIRLCGFQLSDAQWDAFLIPINMAFFFRSSPQRRVLAMYSGPAGATESTLDLAAWDDLVAANPVLEELDEDVEALLINRVDGAREYYRIPIDRCYQLVGVIRLHWHGISGGQDAREAIQQFFADLRAHTDSAQARDTRSPAHA